MRDIKEGNKIKMEEWIVKYVKNGPGRPIKEYDKEKILQLIYRCIEEQQIIGVLKWSVIHKFSLFLYKNGEIPYFSEDFWRKKGRQGTRILLEVNQLYSEGNNRNIKEDSKVINTEEIFKSFYKGDYRNQKKIIELLRINEIKAKKYFEDNVKQKNKILILEKEIDNHKKKLIDWKNKYKHLEKLLFQIMELSQKKGFSIEDIFIISKTKRTKMGDNMLNSVFSEFPNIAYDFEEYLEEKQQKKDSIIQFEKKKKSALDDFGEF